MKRNLIFAIGSLGVGVLLTVGIYGYSYFYPQKYEKKEDGTYINIEASAKKTTFPVDEMTSFLIEYYYPDEEKLLTEQVDEIPMLLGCDKAGVEQYLSEYMKHLSIEEQNEGLISYELTKYQEHQLTLRKTFKKIEKPGFYARSFNGYIVILKSDDKTVYEYTPIMIHMLPERLQKEIERGYYLEDEEALYSFLESYSS